MKKNTPNKPLTTVSFILDESGSMSVIKEATIAGFNKYLKSLQKEKGTFLMTLSKFDSRGIRVPYVLKNVKSIEPLTDATYQPGMNTPLYDSCVETIEKIQKEIKDNQPSLVVIMTDGQENDSRRHTEKCLSDLIHKLEHKGNWTFVFLGANQDSWMVASRMGFARGNVMDWMSTNEGITDVFRGLAQNTAMYACNMAVNDQKGLALNSSNFFNTSTTEPDKGAIKP
jgi:hypothetical protein